MNHKRIFTSLIVVAAAGLATVAQAKLAPPSDEAKAAAAAAAHKAAWAGKVAAFQLCNAQDKVVAHYLSSARSAGKEVKPATSTPACADPGPYVAAEAKPIEAAGAHSPAATATSPPSTQQPDATANPARKP